MADHKDPTDRAHFWERQAAAGADAPAADFHLELPRHVHKADGQWLHVATPDEFNAAIEDGWSLLPPIVAAVESVVEAAVDAVVAKRGRKKSDA